MNQKVILILLSVMMLSTVSYAQEVIKEGNAVIIDCSKMGSKFYVSEKKEQTTTATNSTAGPDNLSVISSKMSNEKVYKKFEVHKTDNGKLDWENAIKFCATNTLNGSTGWRLPTQRELMLIWILKEKLVANDVSPFNNVYYYDYWSATEGDRTSVKVVAFRNGGASTSSKTNYNTSFRCVRDI